MEWNSKNIIGNVRDRYKIVYRPSRRWDIWRSFYNGWLEGRAEMLQQIREENPIAYEWHNHETGHCYVDYIAQPEMDEEHGYTKTPLYKV